MKSSLILHQHLPYADMINESLDFSTSMLCRSKTLYPFAVISIANEVSCVFSTSQNQYASSGLIENLQQQINEQKAIAKNVVSVLVYAANVVHPNEKESDALVLTITDSQGHNTVTIYPYKHVQTGIKIYSPYTCDFSD